MERQNDKILNKVEDTIQKGIKIVLFNSNNSSILRCLSETADNSVQVWALKSDAYCENIEIVSQEEMNCLVDLYHLYEFTDKLILFMEEQTYPGIMNYVTQGLLTERDLVEAMLH